MEDNFKFQKKIGGKNKMAKDPQGIVSHIMGGHKGSIKGKLLGKGKKESVTQEAVENILER